MRHIQTRSASHKQERREQSEIRNANWRTLNAGEKWKALNFRLGKNVGAVRQRLKIAQEMGLVEE